MNASELTELSAENRIDLQILRGCGWGAAEDMKSCELHPDSLKCRVYECFLKKKMFENSALKYFCSLREKCIYSALAPFFEGPGTSLMSLPNITMCFQAVINKHAQREIIVNRYHHLRTYAMTENVSFQVVMESSQKLV